MPDVRFPRIPTLGPVTKCRHPVTVRRRAVRIRSSSLSLPTARPPAPAAGDDSILAAQRRQQARQVVWANQYITRLRTLAGTHDAAALKQVHEPTGLREAHPELALQHRGRAELRGDDQLG